MPVPTEEFPITFGSSEYARTVLGALWGLPPSLDLDYERRVQACCRTLIAEGLVESAHDVSDGGLGVCLAECCLWKGIGATVDFPPGSDRLRWLFAEDPSRIVVSVPGNYLADANRIAAQYDVKAEAIGTTGGSALRVLEGGQVLFEIAVAQLRIPYETALETAVEAKIATVA